MTIEWWQWLVLGLVLIASELAVPAFVLVWFGLSALVLGAMVWLLPAMSLATQLLCWTILSLALIVLWQRVFKKSVMGTRAGTADQIVGETGLLVGDVAPFKHGEVRFQRPVLGSDVWDCIADTEIRAGERVVVVGVEGSTVKIQKRA